MTIKVPSTPRARSFYKLHYMDGVSFSGATIEEAFRNQKDFFEPEISMVDYLEHFRDRLLILFGVFYEFKTIKELIAILQSHNLLLVEYSRILEVK